MTSTIIELSQSEAQTVNQNGDYQISLPQNRNLILEKGDSIQLKNTFIDTESQSTQKIVIKDEIVAELSFYQYYTYSRQDELVVYDPNTFSPTPVIPSIDAQPYIICKDISAGVNLTHMTEFTMKNITPIWLETEFRIKYTNSSGVETQTNVLDYLINGFQTITVNRTNSQQPFYGIVYDNTKPIEFVVKANWDFNAGTYKPLPPDTFPTFTITKETPVSTTEPHFEPILKTASFTIDKGNYSPQLLSREINRKLQSAGNSGEENKYLLDNQLLSGYDSDNGSFFLVRQDGNEIIKLDGQLLLGASQVDLEFEPDTNQFSWNFLHMPYFTDPVGSVAGQPAIGYIPGTPVGGIPLEYFTVNKNSGVAFTSLTSSYVNIQEPSRLWDNILGFDLINSNLLVGYTVKTLSGYNGVPVLTTITIEPPILDGENTTGGFIPLSSQVNKTSTSWYKPAVILNPAPTGVVGTPFLSTSIDTVNILGSQNTISNTQFSYGYYLVEVSGNFKTNYYSNQKSPNIMAIVSRYYELNSFTSGSSADSLVYTHESEEPITLSSFGIRILQPSKQIADNLGKQTTVFLEIVRGEQD
tara:strand:- start:280 stop:2031 length:1752 start_codon:yes stop_codon:yes gene_type:complete